MRLLTDVVKKTKRGETPYHAPFFLPRGKEAERSFFNVIVYVFAVLLDPVIFMSKDITKLILPSIFWSSSLSAVV